MYIDRRDFVYQFFDDLFLFPRLEAVKMQVNVASRSLQKRMNRANEFQAYQLIFLVHGKLRKFRCSLLQTGTVENTGNLKT